jgi:hypothetical protein
MTRERDIFENDARDVKKSCRAWRRRMKRLGRGYSSPLMNDQPAGAGSR